MKDIFSTFWHIMFVYRWQKIVKNAKEKAFGKVVIHGLILLLTGVGAIFSVISGFVVPYHHIRTFVALVTKAPLTKEQIELLIGWGGVILIFLGIFFYALVASIIRAKKIRRGETTPRK